MSDEKPKEHEGHEHKAEAKTITIKKDTLWKGAVFVLLVALIISMFTGGFGIGKATGNATNNGNTGNTGNSGSGNADLSAFTSDSSLFPSLGPDNAKYTVIEFADFQCPYCALAAGLADWTKQSQYSQYSDLIGVAKNVENLAEQNKDVRFIFATMNFLDNPSSQYGTESTYAGEAAYCAADQGKFWEMHDAIYAASTGPSEDDGKYTKANLKKIAATISGLDTSKFNSCLDNDTDLSKVQQSAQAASSVVQGTPTFFVNGKQVSASWSAIKAAIGQ